jgi:hypothetical protein
VMGFADAGMQAAQPRPEAPAPLGIAGIGVGGNRLGRAAALVALGHGGMAGGHRWRSGD